MPPSLVALAAQTQFIDDFSSDNLSAYTLSRVLDNDTAVNISFTSPGGILQAPATATSPA